MTHSDDKGLVLPPKLAPIQVVIVPIYKGETELNKVSIIANKLKEEFEIGGITVKYDNRDNFKPGYKFNEYELKGIPLRIVIGPKDIQSNSVEIARRDNLVKSKIKINEVVKEVKKILIDMQESLFNKASNFRNKNITLVDSFDDFNKVLNDKGGFVSAHWDGTVETENLIKKKTKATIRCIPYNNKLEDGFCIYSGKPSIQRVLFAKAY
tara:strand:- start:219 stop:848 length:630 start_codon:yes stop_codon:yes gene_type:complete